MQNLDTDMSRKLRALLQKKERSDNQLNSSDMKKLNVLRKKLEKLVLKTADVICCTCSGAGDPRLSDLRFKQGAFLAFILCAGCNRSLIL